ncbi:MAG: acyl-CoA dehydratase activase-related protein [Coriobacteriia bacterium]|nr:acyl-CoA dehydratase activase-related protein [Coriobacteriia bacterium]
MHVGIDIGSMTVKMVVLDEQRQVLSASYHHHRSDTRTALVRTLAEVREVVGDHEVTIRLSGSAGLRLADRLGVGFTQEVVALRTAVREFEPCADVVIELGGEDAKIVYLSGSVEERMNGLCAGGTGAFIDQMAMLLKTDAAGLDALAAQATTVYPIAARCGVFAKSDIQPLLNDGARREDVAASVLQSVVTQTISGLACGRPVRGNVVFLGGPLNYLPELRNRFIETLGLGSDAAICPEDAHLFVATGAALLSRSDEGVRLGEVLERLRLLAAEPRDSQLLPQLFSSPAEYSEFCQRHAKASVPRAGLGGYKGDVFLGIDAGSTTLKIAVVGEGGELLYTSYNSNHADIIGVAKEALLGLYRALPSEARIASSVVTGYGEALLLAGLRVDSGEIETIAHSRGASEFVADVDFVLDIGGQDMKCLHLSGHVIDRILLNEACSSGCGSFLETFASSLGLSIEDFARQSLFADSPVDLGSRCTVFMNSRVRQAQKEGATVSDIAAGLCYSVVKNALYKVIRIHDFSELGEYIVVQGGTFINDAVLRAFELITGREVIRPDIAGLMGAWGAALIARDRAKEISGPSTLLTAAELEALRVEKHTSRCRGCANTCTLTKTRFDRQLTFVSGNRCERGAGAEAPLSKAPDLFAYKYNRVFGFEPLAACAAPLGEVGIPRALNLYENYPFWFTFFTHLGFRVVLSDPTTKATYENGIESMPSESVCYPAKLSHGHVENLVSHGVKRIFMPCIRLERAEDPQADNHYNCPIIMSYPEALNLNIESLAEKGIDFRNPFLPYHDRGFLGERIWEELGDWGFSLAEAHEAVKKAWEADQAFKDDVRAEARRTLEWIGNTGGHGIVLAGRPYHVDPEINHGIPQMIARLGFAVLTEDSVSEMARPSRPLRVFDQWAYHTRLYSAAVFVASRDDVDLVQLNSFGCGIDAIAIDQVAEILSATHKIHTVLKIDETNNVGAARIRIRSLVAALAERHHAVAVGGLAAADPGAAATQAAGAGRMPPSAQKAVFSKRMRDEGWTILCPQMAPIHFDLLAEAFLASGYKMELLEVAGPGAVEEGLRHINNDACYPALIAIGQLLEALRSGHYDPHRTAVLISQTGGICRATNYIGLLRKALADSGLSHVPVISLNAFNTGEDSPGFRITVPMLARGLTAVVYGDTLSRCLYRTRPYEVVPGSAEALYACWNTRLKSSQHTRFSLFRYCRELRRIVADFDALPLTGERKPRVGIVGEILVKYHPDANNHVVDLIEAEGCEATVGDLMGFLIYSSLGGIINRYATGTSVKDKVLAIGAAALLEWLRSPAKTALRKSRRFEPPVAVARLTELAKEVLSLCNLMGEGWLLTAEMRELVLAGVPNIVCVQPFGCLPNHVVGKGVMKKIRRLHPQANVVAVDYDPGASQTNQMNRIKLMITTAKERHEERGSAS